MTQSKPNVLDCPTKSLNDKRNYRVISLQNGLTAILISDKSEDDKDEHSTAQDSKDNENRLAASSDEESDMDDDFSGDEDEDEDEEDKGEDDYESGEDDEDGEGNTSKKKSKPTAQGEKLSAAGLCVGIGSFSDPANIPGLSHFLEHMVFMGSDKYPDENEFDAFVKKHGGGTNAFTGCERTVFYFDIKKSHFPEGLDRFAQFFVHPLMKKDSVEREIKAVDSEFDMSKNSDSARKEQLLGSLATNGHPMGKFMWGNTDSLKDTPARENLDVYGKLHDYRKRMYSSHYMTLAVQSRDTLDDLEALVMDIFKNVPHNDLPQPDFCQEENPFENEEFKKLYKVVPIKDKDSVELTWSLPSQKKNYKKKPLHYLGWILGHEGKGSFMSYLKNKLWATTVYSGNSESSFEQNDTWSCFSVEIQLTKEGLNNVEKVVSVLFSYLAMLRKMGPQERIYKEITTIEDNTFRWLEQVEPADYVETICENMQLYPPSEYLTGDRLMFEYDPDLIEFCTSFLVPSKANVYLKSKSIEQEFSQEQTHTEKWYQTKYTVKSVPENWLKAWENPGVITELHLPEENEYIATDFSLKEPEMPVSMDPEVIRDDNLGKVWFKPDVKFKVPKAYVRFAITCPVINASPKNLCLFDLYCKVINHKLDEIAYAADAASLYYSLSGVESDVTIKVSGFNQKLHKLFETVVDEVAKFELSEDLFKTLKQKLQKSFYNQYTRPGTLSKDIRLGLLQSPYWDVVNQQIALTSITRSDVVEFANRLYEGAFLYGLVQGNLNRQETLMMADYLLTKLKVTPPSTALPEVRCVKLEKGRKYCRVSNLNPTDCNSMLTNYYQWGQADIRQSAVNELLMLHMDEPVFDILRTREQLGYSVFSTFRNTSGIMGISITVCSQATKFSMEQLDLKVEEFLKEFKAKHIDPLSQSEFDTLVNSLVTLKKCEDSNLKEEVDRNWGEISNRTFVFDRLNKEISELENLSLEEFKEFFNKLIPQNGNVKKLSVQVVGSSTPLKDVADAGDAGNAVSESGDTAGEQQETAKVPESYGDVHLTFLPVEDDIKDDMINDIVLYKQQRELYPISRIA